MRIFHIQIIFKQLFLLPVDSLVHTPDIEHIVKYIVTCNDPTYLRNRYLCIIITEIQIISEKTGFIKDRIPLQIQFFRNDINSCRFSAPVSSIENGNRCKINSPEMMPGQNLKRIVGIITGTFLLQKKVKFLFTVRKCKPLQIDHYPSRLSISFSLIWPIKFLLSFSIFYKICLRQSWR